MTDDQGDLHDLRTTVEELPRRMGAAFREDLAQIRAIAAALAESDVTDDVRALRVEVGALTDRLDDDSARTQVLGRFRALEAKLDALAADGAGAAVERLEQLALTMEERLARLATADQVGGIADDLRAQLTQALGPGRGTVVEQLQDHLADVASGEVVGALWDEVQAVRAAVDALDRSAPRAVVPGADAEWAPDAPAEGTDDVLAAVADELAALRAELAEGFVVEPSDALSTSLDEMSASLDLVRGRLEGLVGGLGGRLEPLGEEEGEEARWERLRATLADLPQPAVGEGADVEVLADQVAALRDLVATEIDGLRQAVVAAADRTEQLVRSRDQAPAGAPADHGPDLDRAVLDELKDEIRAAGAIGDQVVDALREELKALRRRIAVKASEKVLDEDQLRQIADAVAARLEKR